MSTDPFPDHSEELAAIVGTSAGPPALSPSSVNQPMIGHWVEAMGDENPVYVSDAAARAAGFPSAVAPPTMLQAWIMQGLRATLERDAARESGVPQGDSATERMMGLLDDEGMTSVVATNSDQSYLRPLVEGERLVSTSVIEAISDIKDTGLGTGRFVTTRTDFVAVTADANELNELDPDDGDRLVALAQGGEPVATMRFRILKYRPKAAAAPTAAAPTAAVPTDTVTDNKPPARRPRPAVTEDIAFWFEAARRHELLIQRCASCQTLRHPPLPACANCRSFEWDTVKASGRGEVYSFVVLHYPQVPGFDYPLAIGLIELEEGTRLMADLGGIDPADITVGMKVEARFVDFDDELSLPVFHPADVAAAGANG